MVQTLEHPGFLVAESVSWLASSREPLTPARAQRRADLIQSVCEPIPVAEDAHTMEYWQLGVYGAFKPRNAWEDWVGQQASVMMFRISRSERIERRLRDLQSLRAIDFWEEDQRLKAEETAANLVAEPGPTYAALWSTPAGCDWLIGRWETLAQVPADEWTEAQKQFVRLVCPVRPSQTLTPGFAQSFVVRLSEQRERTRDADRAQRALAEADISDEVSKPLARIRRYRASLQRELKWYVAQLRTEPPEHRLDHRFHPDYDRQMLEPYPVAAPEQELQNEPNPPMLEPEAETNPVHLLTDGAATDNDAANVVDAVPVETHNSETNPFPESGAEPISKTNPIPSVPDRKKRRDPHRELARQRRAKRRRSR